eukprot:3967306-Pyramimonas_sp.AAC.1
MSTSAALNQGASAILSEATENSETAPRQKLGGELQHDVELVGGRPHWPGGCLGVAQLGQHGL